MGTLTVGTALHHCDDVVLAHVRAAVSAKLRSREPFFLSWREEDSTAQVSVWVSTASVVTFRLDEVVEEPLNAEWVEALTSLANTADGMVVLSEQQASAVADALPASVAERRGTV